MNREIKFRAWHNKAEVMFTVGDSHGTTHPLDCAVYAKQGQDVVLMQYTGLKDKNGKEIYEGDIIKATYKRIDNDSEIIAQVFWMEFRGSWSYKRIEFANNDLYRLVQNGNVVEVIGNIYENPELLTPSNPVME